MSALPNNKPELRLKVTSGALDAQQNGDLSTDGTPGNEIARGSYVDKQQRGAQKSYDFVKASRHLLAQSLFSCYSISE